MLAPLGLSGGWGHLGPPGSGAATLYARDETHAFEALSPYALATWPDRQYNASARDLAKLLAVVIGGGVFDGERLIDRAVVDLLTTRRIIGLDGLPARDDAVGLFWSTETLAFGIWRQRLEGHSGSDPGVFTLMYRTAGTDTGFVLMLNVEPARTPGLIRLARIVTLLAGMPPEG